ncbi:MAG TPA: nuclear transport factor 2 family protein [Pyrinomonadaceae bacterium]|jgi:hypothetical protein
MKGILLFVLFIAAASAVFGQTKTEKLVEEIKKMDSAWQVESYSSRDLKDFDRIVAEDFLMMGANGKTISKADKRASVAKDYTDSATKTADYTFKIDEASHQVRAFDKTVVSSGYIIEKYVWKGTPVNGRVYFTCIYLKRNGKWQVVAAQYTNIKQP